MTPSDWIANVDEECRQLIVLIGTGAQPDLGYLRKLFDEPVEVTEATWNIRNLIASLAMTDPAVLKGRVTLQNAAIERLTQVRRYIQHEAAHHDTKSIVPGAPA